METPEGAFLMLLVDSEGPVADGTASWDHLHARDRWRRPDGADDDQAHLMVQCMESWFLADRAALTDYFGQGFLINSLPHRADVEGIPKADVERGLARATVRTRQGRYHKTRHGFHLLARIDPEQVRRASQHAHSLFEALERIAIA